MFAVKVCSVLILCTAHEIFPSFRIIIVVSIAEEEALWLVNENDGDDDASQSKKQSAGDMIVHIWKIVDHVVMMKITNSLD